MRLYRWNETNYKPIPIACQWPVLPVVASSPGGAGGGTPRQRNARSHLPSLDLPHHVPIEPIEIAIHRRIRPRICERCPAEPAVCPHQGGNPYRMNVLRAAWYRASASQGPRTKKRPRTKNVRSKNNAMRQPRPLTPQHARFSSWPRMDRLPHGVERITGRAALPTAMVHDQAPSRAVSCKRSQAESRCQRQCR
jgi:hypothetical protein